MTAKVTVFNHGPNTVDVFVGEKKKGSIGPGSTVDAQVNEKDFLQVIHQEDKDEKSESDKKETDKKSKSKKGKS